MSKKIDGTWINLHSGTREALDLYIMGVPDSRTKFVTELVEDAIADKLEAMPHDVGITLDNMHPGKNMREKYKELIARVRARREPDKEVIKETIDEEEYNEEIDSSVINSIRESS